MKRSDIRRIGVTVVALLLLAATLNAQPATLSPTLAPAGFLVGTWQSEQGHAEGGTQIKGYSHIEPTAGGTALLRRDQTQIRSATGLPPRTMDQVMLVYPENGQIRADYVDGTHVIHDQQTQIEPGHLVRFTTTPIQGAPAFRLTYTSLDANRLSIKFEMMPPGHKDFRTVAEGTARRTP